MRVLSMQTFLILEANSQYEFKKVAPFIIQNQSKQYDIMFQIILILNKMIRLHIPKDSQVKCVTDKIGNFKCIYKNANIQHLCSYFQVSLHNEYAILTSSIGTIHLRIQC